MVAGIWPWRGSDGGRGSDEREQLRNQLEKVCSGSREADGANGRDAECRCCCGRGWMRARRVGGSWGVGWGGVGVGSVPPSPRFTLVIKFDG